MRKYEPDFNIRDFYKFSINSREILKQYEELFELVYSASIAMATRYSDFYKYNEQMKEHSLYAVDTFNYMDENIPMLKTEHENFLNKIEVIDEIDLHEEKIEVDKSFSEFVKQEILKRKQDGVLKDLDRIKTYLNEQMQDINNKLEDLSYVWQDGNFDIFYAEVADGTKELVNVFDKLATPTQKHILLNEQQHAMN